MREIHNRFQKKNRQVDQKRRRRKKKINNNKEKEGRGRFSDACSEEKRQVPLRCDEGKAINFRGGKGNRPKRGRRGKDGLRLRETKKCCVSIS